MWCFIHINDRDGKARRRGQGTVTGLDAQRVRRLHFKIGRSGQAQFRAIDVKGGVVRVTGSSYQAIGNGKSFWIIGAENANDRVSAGIFVNSQVIQS